MLELFRSIRGAYVTLRVVEPRDFEALYAVAFDPLIWEQHPNPDRYKRKVFQQFFDEAIASGSAFVILNSASREIIGSSRYYDYNAPKSEVAIGYTFLSRAYWGGLYNFDINRLMVNYALQHVSYVIFHVGPQNFRSQKALEKLGAIALGQHEHALSNGSKRASEVYRISHYLEPR